MKIDGLTLYSELIAHSGSTRNSKKSEALIKAVRKTHRYPMNRRLGTYESAFGTEFRSVLNDRNSKLHWIDAGAGNCKALLDYEKRSEKKGLLNRKLTAITLQTAPLRRGTKVIIKKRPFESITVRELGRAELITDFSGVLTYTTNIGKVLEKYFRILPVGGTLFVVHPEPLTLIRTQDGRYCTMRNWIGRLGGVSLKKGRNSWSYAITKKKKTINIPKLRLVSAASRNSLFRLFEEVR